MNPIVTDRNLYFNLGNVESYCQHTKTAEDFFGAKEPYRTLICDRIIISLQADSESESDFDSTDSDSPRSSMQLSVHFTCTDTSSINQSKILNYLNQLYSSVGRQLE